jgi:hypothetical protein
MFSRGKLLAIGFDLLYGYHFKTTPTGGNIGTRPRIGLY